MSSMDIILIVPIIVLLFATRWQFVLGVGPMTHLRVFHQLINV
jgi:hypothetical protein